MLKSTWKSAAKNHVIYYTMYCKKQKTKTPTNIQCKKTPQNKHTTNKNTMRNW